MSSEDFGLFVGLGNPGAKYSETRHNIGFMALEKIAKDEGANFRKQKKLNGLLTEIRYKKTTIRLLMPTTFMNESGTAIRAALHWFGLNTSQLVVLVDDMDLPLGRMRFRTKGGSGGHNGLKSTIQHLGTENFCRLRIGIGGPTCLQAERKRQTVSHVLGTFTPTEKPLVQDVLNEVMLGLKLMQEYGIEKATTHINSYHVQQLF